MVLEMPTGQFCPCDPAVNGAGNLCHPDLRSSFNTATPVDVEKCFQNTPPCHSCCVPNEIPQTSERCDGKTPHYGQEYGGKGQVDPANHLHCVAHSCPLGKIVCCSGCNNDCAVDRDIINAVELSPQPNQEGNRLGPQDLQIDGVSRQKRERACCDRKTSWTEPRMCRCDLANPADTSKRCECECGATIAERKDRIKDKKNVRFDDHVTTIDCDQAFRNLGEADIKELCNCCKQCAVKGEDQCVGKPVLLYELPEPKFEGTSITKNDFCWKKTPPRGIPPWHPSIKDHWCHIDVPSFAETTYQCDFKPPHVFHGEGRSPVYLAPQREERGDPCQELAQEHATWRKTSTGPAHVYHSTCDTCDDDLHRVHLHECDATHLPPQYQCHGDGHVCQPPYHAADQFALCEVGDAEKAKSKYWWKRSCCGETEQSARPDTCDLPLNVMNPTCPGYTTSYNRDYRDPKRLQDDRMYFQNCTACDYCAGEPKIDMPKVSCTADTSQPLSTQRAGFI